LLPSRDIPSTSSPTLPLRFLHARSQAEKLEGEEAAQHSKGLQQHVLPRLFFLPFSSFHAISTSSPFSIFPPILCAGGEAGGRGGRHGVDDGHSRGAAAYRLQAGQH
ncbi:unnamed protein product, partial [Closterium sp. NIES-54]